MTFLLTNDDGIDAPGLQTLETLVADFPHTVAAPRQPHSGCGHRVTAHQPIRVETFPARQPFGDEIEGRALGDVEAHPRYAIHGTPADCTRLAIACLCPIRPHWVLSGINAGGNLGVDVYISGTVAAVREAAYQGIPGIAISQYLKGGQLPDWLKTASWTARVIDELLKRPPEPGCFWNVNLPWPMDVQTTSKSEIPELVFCEPSRDPLPLYYEQQGSHYSYNGRYGDRVAAPGSDVAVCFGGSIAITQLSA